jgi:hypothetical protein
MKESQLIGNILAEDVDDAQHRFTQQDTKKSLEAKAKVAASISRSSSAPPSILPEEVLTTLLRHSSTTILFSAFFSVFFYSFSSISHIEKVVLFLTLCIKEEPERISPKDPRLDPNYYAYYYSQRPLDHRLPPPLPQGVWNMWTQYYRSLNGMYFPLSSLRSPFDMMTPL